MTANRVAVNTCLKAPPGLFDETGAVWTLTAALVALGGYTVTLVAPIPGRLDVAFRYALWPAGLAVVALYYAFAAGHRWGGVLPAASTSVMFALPLAALWNTGISEPNVLAGLLPWSDANGYYADARRLLAGEPFSLFSSRRPLFAGTLAVLLAATGMNLQLTLAVLVAVVVVSALLLAREVQATEGPAAAALVLTLLFLFFRRFEGTTLTENLGVALGSIAMALVWRGGRTRNMVATTLGLFLLTLGLAARAGAFFVLPAIVLSMAWAFRQTRRWSSTLALGVAVVALALASNVVVLRAVGAPNGLAFSNYAYHFYGIVVGGEGWGRATVDHPELMGLQEPERSNATYRLALAALREEPWRAFTGVSRSWIDYANPGGVGAFGFAGAPDARAANVTLRVLLFLLSLVGIVTCWRERDDPTRAVAGAAALGIFLSVPLVPPRDADQMRAYAATIGCSAVLVAIGLGACARRARLMGLVRASERGPAAWTTVAWGALLAAFTVCGPLATRAIALGSDAAESSGYRTADCGGTSEVFPLVVGRGSHVRLVADDARSTRVPQVRHLDFVDGLQTLGQPAAAAELSRLAVGTVTATRADANTEDFIWIVSNAPPSEGHVVVCGRMTASAVTGAYKFLKAESVAQ